MPTATVTKKFLSKKAAAKVGIAAMRKILSNEIASLCSGQSRPGANSAAKTVAGTKLSQRAIHGCSLRPDKNSAGKMRGRQVTAAMPQMVRKICD